MKNRSQYDCDFAFGFLKGEPPPASISVYRPPFKLKMPLN